MRLPIDPRHVAAAVSAQINLGRDSRPLVVAGARELLPALARALGAGGEPGAVVEGGTLRGAAALVYVLAGAPSEVDRRELEAARKTEVPVVVVQTDPRVTDMGDAALPTETVVVPAGEGFPVARIATLLAKRLGDRGPALAARLPMLRDAVCAHAIERAARQNALVGFVVFVPGADFPVMTLNQLRLVLQIGTAHGHEVTVRRLPEALGVLGAGLGLRGVARSLLSAVPVGGWLLKGGVGFVGTRALGEAAIRYYRSPVVDQVERLG